MIIDMDKIHGPAEKIKPIRLIHMEPTVIPEDSLISMETIETLSDLFIERAGNVSLVFTPDTLRVLECWTTFPDLFRYEPAVLSGVPGVEPSADFDKLTYNLSRVAYHSVTADIAEEVRRAESMTDEEREASIYARERSQYTNKKGGVKEFRAFDAPNVNLDPEDDPNASTGNE